MKIKAFVFALTVALVSLPHATFVSGADSTFDATSTIVTDGETGRAINVVNVRGHNTSRAYFTQRMWTSDSKRLIMSDTTDGYSYEYNLETNRLRQLVKSGSDFYVTPNDYMYYTDRVTKTINRINLNTYQIEQLASYFDYTTTPSLFQVSNDDSKLTVGWAERLSPELDYAVDTTGKSVLRTRRIPVLDIKTGQWDLRYSHEFDSPYPQLTHIMINPVYTNLVFFCHEGTTQNIPDRLWSLDTNTGEQKNIFKQFYNSLGNTGETSGHEAWNFDGEHMTFVKYTFNTNVGQSGIMRIDKFGEKREYINNDYHYWHCFPSDDNRWVVSDTQEGTTYNSALGFNTGMTDIVLIDSKTSKSYKTARVLIGVNHPWQPHPSFSPDGKKVCFSMINSSNVLSVGIADVSDIVNTGDVPDVSNKNVNEDKGFTASSVSLNDAPLNEVEAQTTVVNSGDSKDFTFLSASYINGKLNDLALSTKKILTGKSETFNNKINKTSEIKNLLWGDLIGLVPYSLVPTPPENLRMLYTGPDTITLFWFPSQNLSDIKEYVVYRDGQEIGRVKDGYFKDSNLTKGTTYEYEVRSCFESGLLSPPAHGRFATVNDAYSILDNPIEQSSMSFVINPSTAADSYTEAAFYAGRNCRKSTSQLQTNGTTKTGKFYFRMDRDYILLTDSKVNFEVTYFDEGTQPIYVQYNSPTSVAQSVKIADRKDTGQWVTSTVSVNDARFVRAEALTKSDFRIEGGSNTYLYKVKVTKPLNQNVVYQAVTAQLGASSVYNGLTLYESSGTGDFETSA